LAIAIAIPISITLLLSNKSIQKYAVQKATDALTELLYTKVEVKSVAFELPASLALNGVLIEDTEKDTLAYIDHISARLAFKDLLFNKITIKDGNIDNLYFHLKADSTGTTNLQFIIDKFSEIETGPISSIFSAPDITIRGGKFRFDKTNSPYSQGDTFDASHILFSDINIDVSLNYASADSVNVSLEKFSCIEKSGLTIDNIQCIYKMWPKGMGIENFLFEMPKSKISIPIAQINYDSISLFQNVKELLNCAVVKFNMSPSYISGDDLSWLYSATGNLRNNLNFTTDIKYNKGKLDISALKLSYGNNTVADFSASVKEIDKLFITNDSIDLSTLEFNALIRKVATNRADIENTISDITRRPFKLPKELQGFSKIQYTGSIVGKIERAKYVGRISTDAGYIVTQADAGYNKRAENILLDGNIKIADFDISRIVGKDAGLGKISLNVNTSSIYYLKTKRAAAKAAGEIRSFDYSGYEFKHIQFDGLYNPEKIIASIFFNDENGNGTLSFDAFCNIEKESSTCELIAKVDTLKLGNLGLSPKYPHLSISTDIYASTQFSSIDKFEGEVNIDTIDIRNDNKRYVIDSLNIYSFNDEYGDTHFSIKSPIIKGNIDGKLTPSSAINNIINVITSQLSNIKPLSSIKKMDANNDFTFNFEIMPLTQLSSIFSINATIADTTIIEGSFNDNTDKLSLQVNTNNILFKNNSLDSLNVYINNYGEKVNMQVDGFFQTKLDTTYLGLTAGLYHNQASIEYSFWNVMENDFSGSIRLSSEFFEPKHSDANIETLVTMHNSEVTISDSTWIIQEGKIFYDEYDLDVKDLAFEGTDAFLRINGHANKEKKGHIIKVDMKNIDLSYISEVFYLPDIKLLGIATGKVVVGGALEKKPILDADVEVLGFGLNGYEIADAKGTAKFNHDNDHIELNADVWNKNRDYSHMGGYIAPLDNHMLLDIDINELPLGFIEPYLVSFSHEMDGIASGKLYVGGPLDKVLIWGDAYVHDAKLGIDYLKSTFHFSDSVHIKKDQFIFNDIHVTDDFGHEGVIDGLVTHNNFENFKYRIGFSIDNLRVLNTTAVDFPDFYGTIYASGNALIDGDENKVDITVSAKPENGSYFAVPLDSYSSATDNQFITFVKVDTIKTQNDIERHRKRFFETAPTTKMNIDISVEATPDVEARIIMDSHSGDVIRATGNGNIKVNVDQNANVKIFGKYDIIEGDYNFSLQGAIRKKFEVGDNSSISFDGDPMNGMMNINAKYQTTASLTDLLDESLTYDIKNTNVKVDCMAKIQGSFLNPKIKFDLQFPDSDDEVARRVKAYVNTEDMMLQQMVFLLVFGKFYNTQQTSTSKATTSYASSFATSTISSQLNYWMSQISNNVNLGFNYNDSQKDATNNYSVAVNVSTNLFDNRLVLYGNVGYRRQYGQENFIGDFDAEYKLTKSGRFRLKAYNKTNDIIYSTALYTQGLGVMYKETFDTWENLGQTYKELTRKKTPEEKAAIKEQKEKEKAEKAKQKAAKKALKEDRKRRHNEYVAQQKALKQEQKAQKKAQKEAKQ